MYNDTYWPLSPGSSLRTCARPPWKQSGESRAQKAGERASGRCHSSASRCQVVTSHRPTPADAEGNPSACTGGEWRGDFASRAIRSTLGDTQVCARAIPLQTVRNGADRELLRIEYVPFHDLRAQVRRCRGGQHPINQSVLPELSIFICPLQQLTPTPKSTVRPRLIDRPLHFFYFVSLLHYNPLTP